ncbi:MAG: hypothetical protein EXS35_11585 [Pedosphaera sp.]|nr:hypothetical protein [Pedosphaera sp.]
MKTNLSSLWVSLLTLAVTGTAALAQDANSASDENATYEAPDATTVVYEAPVTYTAPVVYQASVVYYGPVFYLAAPAVAACAAQTPPPCQQSEPASTVTVIGVHGGVYTYSNQPTSHCENTSSSSVVQFGQRGGWFGGRW